jgi:predicted NBD/HSP70 family sugar kinase
MFDAGSNLNPQKMKEQNSLLILHAIRRYGPVSRINLAHILGLSNTTCASLTKDLLAAGLIRETGYGDSNGGRKPVLLEINWDAGYVIGMALSLNELSCGVYDLQFNRKELLTRSVAFTEENIIPVIESGVREAIRAGGLSESDIVGMTIGLCGIVSAEKADIISSVQFNTRGIVRLHDQLAGIFSFPLYMENDGDLLALAEKKLFYPQSESLAFILVENGIGSGVIINDQIRRGFYGCAGEIGHISIDKNGPVCPCGNRGCIETLGSIPVLLQKASFGLMNRPNSLIRDYMEGNSVTVEAIARACNAGDPLAEELFEEEAVVLYHAVINTMLLYDPQVIVLGGGIIQLGTKLIDRIKEKIEKTIFAFSLKDRLIEFSRLADNPMTRGAGLYAVETFFTNSLFLNNRKPAQENMAEHRYGLKKHLTKDA